VIYEKYLGNNLENIDVLILFPQWARGQTFTVDIFPLKIKKCEANDVILHINLRYLTPRVLNVPDGGWMNEWRSICRIFCILDLSS